jgi:hypothetical protein
VGITVVVEAIVTNTVGLPSTFFEVELNTGASEAAVGVTVVVEVLVIWTVDFSQSTLPPYRKKTRIEFDMCILVL